MGRKREVSESEGARRRERDREREIIVPDLPCSPVSSLPRGEGVGAFPLRTLRCEDGYPHALIGGTILPANRASTGSGESAQAIPSQHVGDQ